MSLIEAGFRGGAIALLVLLAMLALRDTRRSALARYRVLFALSVAAYVVEMIPDPAWHHSLWRIPVSLVSIGTAAVFWLWTRAHFDDDFVPSWRGPLVWVGLVALGAVAIAVDRPIPWRALQSVSLLLVGLGIWQTLSGRPADLVESRRRLRIVLAVGAAIYIAAINLAELLPNWSYAAQIGSLGNAIGIAMTAFAFTALALAPVRDAADPATAAPSAGPPPRTGGPEPPPDPADSAPLDALRRLMEDDKTYREEGLNIASLAARLGIPEYRLRRLINQRLGHRNFTSFVNGYRLDEAIAALADPSQDPVPILTIALDTGFQSIGPFNRAFKLRTGITPSEFRRHRLDHAAE